jgi:hypothetical protein
MNKLDREAQERRAVPFSVGVPNPPSPPKPECANIRVLLFSLLTFHFDFGSGFGRQEVKENREEVLRFEPTPNRRDQI